MKVLNFKFFFYLYLRIELLKNRCLQTCFQGCHLRHSNSNKYFKKKSMKILIRIILACFTIVYFGGCSAKEESIFCLSDDYLITTKTPVLNLSNAKFSKETEGMALLVLSINDSLTVIDWDLLNLTLINKAKRDTLVNYTSFQANSVNKGVIEYRTDLEAFVRRLKISLKEGIAQASRKKVQITVKVESKS